MEESPKRMCIYKPSSRVTHQFVAPRERKLTENVVDMDIEADSVKIIYARIIARYDDWLKEDDWGLYALANLQVSTY